MSGSLTPRRSMTRRRLLAGSGALAAGAAGLALVGCGEDGEGPVPPTPTPTPVDPFAAATRGGTYRVDLGGDPPTLDPYANLKDLTRLFSAYVYSRLFTFGTGPGIPWGSVRPVPDAADSAEPSPDGLSWVVRLREGLAFHDLAPVNGRGVTAQDVLFSWARLTAPTTHNRSAVSYVDRVEAPDDRTVRFVLKEPHAAFLEDLADANLLLLQPAEADGRFDPSRAAIGSGPWVLQSYEPGARIGFDRNPSWHVPGFPLFDGVELAVVAAHADRVERFLAGKTDSVGLYGSEVVGVHASHPAVQLVPRAAPTLSMLFFDGNDPAAIYNRDPRVRQAVSMALDRDALSDAGYRVSELAAAGLTVDVPWHNVIPAGETLWWLDRADDSPAGMGRAARFWRHDPAAARALLSAAGADGLALRYQYPASRYGGGFTAIAEAQAAMLAAIGIDLVVDVQDYDSTYSTKTFAGDFEGLAFGYELPFAEVGSYFTRLFTDDPWNHARVNDADLRNLAVRQGQEIDPERRRDIIHDIQRRHGERLWYIPSQAGAGAEWTAYRAGLQNVTYATRGYGYPAEVYPYLWFAT